MSDRMNIFKELDVGGTSQWFFYDERFQNFLNFLNNHVTEENFLTEQEVLQYEDLLSRKEICNSDEEHEILRNLEISYPGLLTISLDEIEKLQQNIFIKEEMLNDYEQLVTEMRNTKTELDGYIHSLEVTCQTLEEHQHKTYSLCLEITTKLGELHDDNYKEFMGINKIFSKMKTSTIFMHQMPLDQYFLKCDSFLECISSFIKNDFNNINCEIRSHDLKNSLLKEIQHLEHLENLMYVYKVDYITELAKTHGIQNSTYGLTVYTINESVLKDLKHEIGALSSYNDSEENCYNKLIADLKRHVLQRTQQIVELILYKNNQAKFERVNDIYKKLTLLLHMMFKVLSSADIFWIAMQIDMEKIHTHLENREQLIKHRKQSLKRLRLMHREISIISTSNSVKLANIVLNQFCELLSKQSKQPVQYDQKSCLREYKKFELLLQYNERNLLQCKHFASVSEGLKHMDNLESILHSIVYDGPLTMPAIDCVQHLKPTFDAKVQQDQFNKQFRDLREQFSTNITERMQKDTFWRYQQMLWIWFLTEPYKILLAIEEVKKIASKKSQIKPLGGIMRK